MSTSLSIGEFEITTVQDHQGMDRNPSEIYSDVPAAAWDPYRDFALDPDGFYRSQWRGHLIRSSGGGPSILVDTGMGPGPHDHTGNPGELIDSLNALCVSPEEIEIVVITHTHGDHIGWNVSYDGDTARATFPNARYLGAVLLILVLDRPLSHVYWLNVADRSIPFVAVVEHTNLIDPSHYGGKHVVYLSNYLTIENPMYKMDKQELLDAYMPHLKKINPDFDPSWIEESYHHRVGAAQPIVGINYASQIPDHRTPFKGLYLANTTQIYPEDRGTNYSVRMGNEVAELVMEDLA